jgi:hypothetical protein
MANIIDWCTVVLTEAVIHPETCEIVAPVGALYVNCIRALREVGADYVQTNIGAVSLA